MRAEQHNPRVFFVHYRFKTCGDVFVTGLEGAAQDLGLQWASASPDDAGLPDAVARFGPDLLFVVHGRRFRQRWGDRFRQVPAAVWLLDEPYEVDDTAVTSRLFQTVFVNDPATMGRHRNAHYLPVAWDPRLHQPGREADRRYEVGFVGDGNATREAMLLRLARERLLSYVVGGPWRSAELRALSVGGRVSPARTADLYRQTRLVVNVFRDRHHFNRARVRGTSLNPRVYEALACGALIVSEERPELEALFPELPSFHDADGLVAQVRGLLTADDRRRRLLESCRARLTGHTYADRLRVALAIAAAGSEKGGSESMQTAIEENGSSADEWHHEWEPCGPVECDETDGIVRLGKAWDPSPGSERGLVSRASRTGVDLSFEVLLPDEACFVAKIVQQAKFDQESNSYHLYCDTAGEAYLARHRHVFGSVPVERGRWQRLRLSHGNGTVSVYKDDALVRRADDRHLSHGYAFLGVKGGEVRLRNVRLEPALGALPTAGRAAEVQAGQAPDPRVSIVTTVYDRVACLRRCIRSVKRLRYQDYEHVIVSDAPGAAVVDEITRLVAEEDDGRIRYLNLPRRHNNWGIAPAAEGLRASRGEFVCFLSDDNGYLPEHLSGLVSALDENPELGFVYSSCLYAGRLVLRHPVPRAARIDLGQPLFRRQLFERCLGNDLPFNVMAWDWALIDHFVRRGVRWKHVDAPTFVFRLARYPHLVRAHA